MINVYYNYLNVYIGVDFKWRMGKEVIYFFFVIWMLEIEFDLEIFLREVINLLVCLFWCIWDVF